MPHQVQIRVHGDTSQPTLICLPGLHGDWTLISSFRAAVRGRIRFVEITYPRTTDWSLHQYAAAVTKALAANKIRQGWILGESFSSQVAWAILEQAEQNGFQMQGLILAGGFVRHPFMAGVSLARMINRAMPMWLLRTFCWVYARYAKFRHRRASQTLASISEFVQNRTNEPDRQAICHRYNVIEDNDLRPISRKSHLPIYQLCGFFDPIVPWPFVRPGLKRNCPGFRGCKIILRAAHNVLGTAPEISARYILGWMGVPDRCSQE